MAEDPTTELIKYMRALIAIQLRVLESSGAEAKPELLLARAGLSAKDIAELSGETPGAIAKAIQRSGIKGA